MIYIADLQGSDMMDDLAGVKNYSAKVCISLSLSLRFNGHFPGEPGLAGVY